jgi:spore germination cell wall hydrolase CwlJ-like protein
MARPRYRRARAEPPPRPWADAWQRLVFRWQTTDKSGLAFVAMLAVPLAMLAGIGRFAYADQVRRIAAEQRRVDLNCLAQNVYYEGRGESLAGQQAIAEVTLNRVASAQFPDTVCDVVHEQRWDARRKRYVGAFSWTELDHVQRPVGKPWESALAVATAVYDEEAESRAEGALFYHATSIEPTWAKAKVRVAKIGNHIFYK